MNFRFLALTVAGLAVSTSSYADDYSYECGTLPDPYSQAEFYHPTGIEREMNSVSPGAGGGTQAVARFSDDRVLGGTIAKIGDFPGLVHLTFIRRGPHPTMNGVIADFMSMCGGTKISDDYIITAAHCVADEKHAIKITYGASDVSSDSAGIAWANKATCHKGYLAEGLENDIALIRITDDSGADMSDLQDVSDAESMDMEKIEKLRARTFLKVAGWPSGNISVKKRHYLEQAGNKNGHPKVAIVTRDHINLINPKKPIKQKTTNTNFNTVQRPV